MFRAQEKDRPISLPTAAFLTLALGWMASGCSGTSGLRSVGTDRPSLFGLWDRPDPAPTDPIGDYYSRYMQSAPDPAAALARRSNGASESAQDGGVPAKASQGDPVVASGTTKGEDGRASRPTKTLTDDSLRVALGPPEPLPALAELAPPPEAIDLLDSTRSSPSNRGPRPLEVEDEPSPGLRPARHTDDPGDDRRETRKADPGPVPGRQPTTKPRDNMARDAKAILARSEAKLQSLSTYQVKISRVERVGGRLLPEEQIILSIHRDPRAVRLEWADGPNQGREVIYASRIDDKSLFVHMAKSAIPLPTMKIPVDSPLVMKNSRHAITEAGFDTVIQNLRQYLDGPQKVDVGRAVYRGIEKPPGLDRPSHIFTRRDPSGETWTVFLDATTLLPSMVVAKDPSGELDERYIYHEVRENPTDLASADAFDPDQRWGQSKGFLSRFARTTPTPDSPNNRQPATR